jgi:hypothetical protein
MQKKIIFRIFLYNFWFLYLPTNLPSNIMSLLLNEKMKTARFAE